MCPDRKCIELPKGQVTTMKDTGAIIIRQTSIKDCTTRPILIERQNVRNL